jgi:hypothetical protein
MPFWATWLIEFAIRFGVPALEKRFGKQIAALISDLLEHLKTHPNPAQALDAVKLAHYSLGIASRA